MRTLILFCIAMSFTPAFAQSPCEGVTLPRKIRLFLGAEAGGSADIAARTVAEALKGKTTMIVENRPGGSGSLAANQAKAAMTPDGSIMYFAQAPEVTVNTKLPGVNQGAYELKDFKPIAHAGSNNYILMCNREYLKKIGLSKPENQNIQGLMDFAAKSENGAFDIKFAHGGTTNMTHIMALAIADTAKIPIKSKDSTDKVGISLIPYKGTSGAMNDVAAGHTDCMVQSWAAAQGFIEDEEPKVVALGALGEDAIQARSGKIEPIKKSLPEFKPMKNWVGFFGSDKMPAKTAACLNHTIRTALETVKDKMALKGFEYAETDPASLEQFSKFPLAESERLEKYAGQVDAIMNNRPITATASATR